MLLHLPLASYVIFSLPLMTTVYLLQHRLPFTVFYFLFCQMLRLLLPLTGYSVCNLWYVFVTLDNILMHGPSVGRQANFGQCSIIKPTFIRFKETSSYMSVLPFSVFQRGSGVVGWCDGAG